MAEKKTDGQKPVDQENTLAFALNKFQAIAPTIPKGSKADIPTKSGKSYSYKYADLAAIWEKIRKPLTDCGLSVVQMPTTANSGDPALRTTIMHISGEKVSEVMRLPIDRDASPQDYGSAITYFKRYALTGALGLVTEDDDDARNLRTVSQEEIYLLKKAAFKKGGVTTAQQFEDLIYGLTGKTSRRIPAHDFDAVMKQIEELENANTNS